MTKAQAIAIQMIPPAFASLIFQSNIYDHRAAS